MPGYGSAFSRGLILGAGAALLYAAARETIAPARARPGDDEQSRLGPGRLIDWEMAINVAIRTAGRTPMLHPGARAQMQANYEAMLRDIEAPIAAYVGNDLSLVNTAVEVLDRPGWIRANMRNFRYLLQP
ncbi:MAG: zinc-dependent metalloprotease, partial [Chloroflexi bacterium]|nr:zinc-dependent metalloprotease [Chloroflexota bacterium]